jgi:VWFA-related protein
MIPAHRRIVTVAFLLATSPGWLGALQTPVATTTSVVAVEIPVEVTLDGKPMRGLTAANFEILDNGEKQKITGFDAVDLALVADTAAPTPPAAARRHFLLLFDLSFSEPSSLVRARRAATEMVRHSLAPSDLVAVATYSSSEGARLVLGFTSDRSQVALALETLGLARLVDRSPDPLRLILASERARQLDPVSQQLSQRDRGRGAAEFDPGELSAIVDAELLDALRTDAQASARADLEVAANQAADLTRAFGELARLLGRLAGRKYVVYLSEGFDSSVLLGSSPTNDERATAEGGEVWHRYSEGQFGSGETRNRMEAMAEEFRRAGCVIQAVDIGGLRAGADAQAIAVLGETVAGAKNLTTTGEDSLFTMAHDTGGELYRNFNDLGAAMSQMLERTAATYLLAFQPPEPRPDGRFHKLQVKLRGLPRGAKVSHRSGYTAPQPFVDQSPAERSLRTAELLLAGEEGGGLDLGVLAVVLPGVSESVVPVVLEIGGSGLLTDHWGDDLPLEAYVYAFDDSGGVGDYLVQSAQLDLTKVRPNLQAGGIKLLGELLLAPGKYSVRALVRNGRTGKRALQRVAIEVTSASTAARLTEPLFPQARGRWLVARTARRDSMPPAGFDPFRLQASPFVPEIRPIVTTSAGVELLVYGAGLGSELTATVRVEREDGSAALAPSAQTTRAISISTGDLVSVPVRLDTDGLPPGQYFLRIEVRDASGAAAAAPKIGYDEAAAPATRFAVGG